MPNEIETAPTANAVPVFAIIPPEGKRHRKYNNTEMAAINVFKDEYLNAETVAARTHVIVAKIIPAMVTVWTNAGNLPTTPEQKISAMKVLLLISIQYVFLRAIRHSKNLFTTIGG